MDPIELYKLLGRQPFQPMRVILKDGRSFDIPTRRFAVVGVDYLDIGRQALGYDDGIWEDCEHLQLQDVARVEPLFGQSTPATR
jgi:hypothetical protein